MSRTVTLLVVVSASLATAACQNLTGPSMPSGAVAMRVPSVYAEWWRMTEACSGRTRDFASIQWYTVPGTSSFSFQGSDAGGVWLGDRIVIAEGNLRDGRLVRHEMLHALRNAPGHPRDDFIARCGTVVTCGPDCWESPTSAPAPSGTLVAPTDLEMSVATDPERPSPTLYDGWFAVLLTLHNPRSERVAVRMPANVPVLFQYTYSDSALAGDGGYAIYAPELMSFAPGETKRVVFDFWIDDKSFQPMLADGPWTFATSFAGRWSSPLTVSVGP